MAPVAIRGAPQRTAEHRAVVIRIDDAFGATSVIVMPSVKLFLATVSAIQ